MTLSPSKMRYSVVLLTLGLTAASAALKLDSGVVIAAITFAGTYTTASKAGEVLLNKLKPAAPPVTP